MINANDAATIRSAVGLVLIEDFLLVKAAKLTARDMAIGTKPRAGRALPVRTPAANKRGKAGAMAAMVTMRRVRSA